MKVYKVKINDSSWCAESTKEGFIELIENAYLDADNVGDKLFVEICDMTDDELESLEEFQGF